MQTMERTFDDHRDLAFLRRTELFNGLNSYSRSESKLDEDSLGPPIAMRRILGVVLYFDVEKRYFLSIAGNEAEGEQDQGREEKPDIGSKLFLGQGIDVFSLRYHHRFTFNGGKMLHGSFHCRLTISYSS